MRRRSHVVELFETVQCILTEFESLAISCLGHHLRQENAPEEAGTFKRYSSGLFRIRINIAMLIRMRTSMTRR